MGGEFAGSRGYIFFGARIDPQPLGDTNAGERFLQVPSIGREEERALPVCLKILPHSFDFLTGNIELACTMYMYMNRISMYL